ncbi:sensor domain-containing protein [Halovenus marina]|uniref:sensor domain-containing protein n=1 Tax=Halovenus marina TaxID=3396621 RepID=UPI003F55E11D
MSSSDGTHGMAQSLGNALGIVTERQTYSNLLYLGLAFPLGVVYQSLVVFGLVAGILLSVVLVGIGILFVTLLGVRAIAGFERRLANRLLGTEIADPDDLQTDRAGVFGTVKLYLKAASTWRSVGFLMVKFWVGVVAFVLLTFTLGIAVELLTAPLGADVVEISINSDEVTFDTVPAYVAMPLGAVLAVGSLHVSNAFAYVNAQIAEGLLS